MQRRYVLHALIAGVLVSTGARSLAQQAAAPGQLTQPPGPATFFSVHAASDLNTLAADVAFLGVPYDGGHSGKTGTRLGPQSIREASRLGPGLPAASTDAGFYDWELGERILAGVRLVDVGNVRTPPGASELIRDRVTEAVAMIVARGAMPAVFGGDHSITFPILRGFRLAGHKVHVIHFDSHADFNNTTTPGDGIQYTHGNHLRHAVDLPFVSGITMIGLRGHLRGEGVPTQARQRGIQMLSASQAVRLWASI